MRSELCRVVNEVELSYASELLKSRGKDPRYTSMGINGYLELRKESSYGQCVGAVAKAALELQRSSREHLDGMAVVSGSIDPAHPFRSDWNVHVGLIVHETKGAWHYISPANFEADELASDIILRAESTAELFHAIVNREGGRWADPSFVESIYRKGGLSVRDTVEGSLPVPEFGPPVLGSNELSTFIISERFFSLRPL